jgi:hypothetical protein
MPEVQLHQRIAQLEGQAEMLSQMIRQAKEGYLAAFLRHKEAIDRAICRQEEFYWKRVELYYTEWGMMSAGDTILTAGLGAVKLPKAAQQLARVRWLLRAHWAASKANDVWSLGSYGKELATGRFPAVEKLAASLPREGKYVVALLAANPEEHIRRTHDQMSSRLYPSPQEHQKIKQLFPSPSLFGTAMRWDRNLRGNIAAETMTFVTRKRYARWLGSQEERLRTGIRQLEHACANLRGELRRNKAALESIEKQAEAARLAALRAARSAAERQRKLRGLTDERRQIDESIRGWKAKQADWTRTQNRLSTDLRRAMAESYRKVMRTADAEIEKLRARRKACEEAISALGTSAPPQTDQPAEAAAAVTGR